MYTTNVVVEVFDVWLTGWRFKFFLIVNELYKLVYLVFDHLLQNFLGRVAKEKFKKVNFTLENGLKVQRGRGRNIALLFL